MLARKISEQCLLHDLIVHMKMNDPNLLKP